MKHSLQIITTLILITPCYMMYGGKKPSIDLTDNTRTILNQEYVEGIEERMHSMHAAFGEEPGQFLDIPALHHNYDVISNEDMQHAARLMGLQSAYPTDREMEMQSLHEYASEMEAEGQISASFIIKCGCPFGEEKQLKRSPKVCLDLPTPEPIKQ